MSYTETGELASSEIKKMENIWASQLARIHLHCQPHAYVQFSKLTACSGQDHSADGMENFPRTAMLKEGFLLSVLL